ncbi:MAG: hypothetical protein EZS28_044587 [Streblomastix strix]|uniref:Uncharacterized protein n=1 Tax=Streblomastix strix TaxID=222440 RepID=A0A5J4TMY3_9EUKA|nr:MAG: hypothetical protein EZS28_044587 [Streblomastix strix]
MGSSIIFPWKLKDKQKFVHARIRVIQIVDEPKSCTCAGSSDTPVEPTGCLCQGGAGDSNTCTCTGDSGIPLTTPQASPDCIVPSCACPQNPTSLIDIPKEQCKCLKTGDLRVGCESKPNCVKPTTTTLTSGCPCLARGDPREECDIDDPCTAAGSLRIQLNFITAAVILPILMLR